MNLTLPLSRPKSGRRIIAVAATASLALAGLAMAAPATATPPPPTALTPDLSQVATWNFPAGAANYDAQSTTVGTTPALRMSNWVSSTGLYGNIEELESPSIANAGEPNSTAALYDTFTAQFTLGATTYSAQPGLAVEVSADDGTGDRTGGSMLFREDTNNRLTVSNFYVKPGATSADDGDWTNATGSVAFTKPVVIKYVAVFKQNATDSVKVYANGNLLFNGGTYEGYERAIDAQPSMVNNLLFRAGHSIAVAGGSWTSATPTADQLTALKGNGFLFTNLSYRVSASKKVITSSGVPTISGTTAVGKTLTAHYTTTPSAVHTFKWYRNGSKIAGATGKSLHLDAKDAGAAITVVEKATKSGYWAHTDTSAPTSAVALGTLKVGTPKITGTLKVGKTLTAKPGTWTAGTKFSYAWLVNDVLTQQSSSATLKLTGSYHGGTVKVEVTGSKTGYQSATTLPVSASATVLSHPAL